MVTFTQIVLNIFMNKKKPLVKYFDNWKDAYLFAIKYKGEIITRGNADYVKYYLPEVKPFGLKPL